LKAVIEAIKFSNIHIDQLPLEQTVKPELGLLGIDRTPSPLIVQ